jgi:ABC-type antimicrobial peptide transport system permease subunit
LLACLGLYGIVSYTVARRTNEIGSRMALGATRVGVLRMIFKESLALVLAGIAIGAPLTIVATRLISARLFAVSAVDPMAALLCLNSVADFNGDRIQDLVVGNEGSNDVSVMLDNGNGTFRPAGPLGAG